MPWFRTLRRATVGEPRRLHIDCATNVSEEFQGQHITSLHVSVPCLGIPDGGSTIGAAPLNALVAATTRRDAPFCVRSLDTFFELFAQRHGREERRASTAWVWDSLRGGMLLSAIENTVSAPKKRQTSGQQIADSNIPTLTVAGVHIACRNNLHGATARQLQCMPMTLWKILAAELQVIPHPAICITILYASQNFCRCIPAYVATGRQAVKARLSVVNKEHNISSKCGWCSCGQKCTDARVVRSFDKI